MKRIPLLILFIFALPITKTKAQDYITILNYTTAAPLSNTKSFIDSYSWRGISIEQRFFIDDNKTIGFLLGWQVFDKTIKNHTIEFPNGNLYGNHYKYINAYPIHGIAHYHFNSESIIRPYLGLGVGVYSISSIAEMGLYVQSIKSWNFGLAPEAGLWIDISSQFNFNLSTKYNYAFASGKIDAQSWLNLNAGLIFFY